MKQNVSPKGKYYTYAIANERTGMDHVGTMWAESLKAAEKQAVNIARLFGPSTIVVGVQLADQPKLPLERRKLSRA